MSPLDSKGISLSPPYLQWFPRRSTWLQPSTWAGSVSGDVHHAVRIPEGLARDTDEIQIRSVKKCFQNSRVFFSVSLRLLQSVHISGLGSRRRMYVGHSVEKTEGAAQIPKDGISDDWLTKTPPHSKQNRKESCTDLSTTHSNFYLQTFIIINQVWIIHRQIFVGEGGRESLISLTAPLWPCPHHC